ncbi:MAG TPA: heme-binding domain-containing protein [Cyclobacteriaceae bacterium]|nr:heme-binding domain-containing protein [Cyclobacteriaceae bacterium]
MLKKTLLALAAVLVVIQFFRPEKNLSDDRTYDIRTQYHVPENINAIMAVACKDCHSNKTRYPWYSNVQPVAWWLASHVEDGKRHLNFSEFTKGKIALQNHKLEEIVETVKEKEMPLPDYTWMGVHGDARLTAEQRIAIVAWASSKMDSLKQVWPADSLVMKRR